MKDVYAIAEISAQAHQQEQKRELIRSKEVDELVEQVDLIREDHPGCGLEKLYRTLQPTCMGRDKFIQVLMSLGYRVRKIKNYRRTTISGTVYYPNLIEGMLITAKNQVWETDITYLEHGNRFYYLTMIIDVFSRVIVGYEVADHLRAEANLNALNMAVKANPNNLKGLIHHSDRGSQYTSSAYLAVLDKMGIVPSMGSIAIENAYAERVNGTIKNEYLKHWKSDTFNELKRNVKRAINHYNRKRLHNSLGKKMTPMMVACQSLSLTNPQRPTVTIYAEGKPKIREVSSLSDFNPQKDLWAPICPMVTN